MGKYEEALERAKSFIERGGEYDRQVMESIFPELKESEDERVRKELLEEIEFIIPHDDETDSEGLILPSYHARIDRYKSYLEKQKEQNQTRDNALQKAFINSKIDYTLEEKCDASDYAETILPTSVTYGEGKEEYKLHKIIEAAFIAGQKKEQKPESCDCSRDEESYTNGIHHVLMNPEAYGLIKLKPAEQLGGTFTSYDMAKTFTEGQNYVIAHPEKFGLCKSAEWKEEDEGMLNCIIATLCEESHGGREANDKMVTWLENRLKSLRPQPHWKPSEEQMKAIENVIKCELSAGLHTRANILQTLQNELKKL